MNRKRDGVDEAGQVGSVAVERPLDPQLAHREEVVVRGLVGAEEARSTRLHAAARVAMGDLHTVAQEFVLLLVRLQTWTGTRSPRQRSGWRCRRLAGRDCWIPAPAGGSARAPLRPRWSGQAFLPVRRSRGAWDRLPAEPSLQVLSGGLLDESVFTVERRTHRVSVIRTGILQPLLTIQTTSPTSDVRGAWSRPSHWRRSTSPT